MCDDDEDDDAAKGEDEPAHVARMIDNAITMLPNHVPTDVVIRSPFCAAL